MIKNRLIICIASCWHLDPTSKHHLMRILSENNDVLWVNYHGSRRPQLNMHDIQGVGRVLRRAAKGAKPVSNRMTQITPVVWPGVQGPVVNRINRALVVTQIRRAIAKRRQSPTQPVQLWTFAPDVAYLAGAFKEEALIYYCVDEFSQFDEFDEYTVRAAERELIRKANIVFTSSAKLYENKAPLHPRVHLMRHGVDREHFARAADKSLKRPSLIKDVPGPIAGFIGLVHHWIDVELMAGVARKMPHVSFVVVGECKADVSQLRALPNVYLTDRQPYSSLPSFCSSFDVGLMPFRLSQMTENVNPIKMREYLAAGLPIVSTAIPEATGLVDPNLIANDVDSFAAACQRAIDNSSIEDRLERSRSMEQHSWRNVAARVSAMVTEVVEPAPKTVKAECSPTIKASVPELVA